MSYKILFSKQAETFFYGLSAQHQTRIKKKLQEISQNPFRYLEHFEGDYRKLRIGNLRALIDIDSKREIIFVRVFDKRGRIYKRNQ